MNGTENENHPSFDDKYINQNILLFRHRCNMTQSEFIKTYLRDKNGKNSVSAGTYSNFENGKGTKSAEIAQMLAEALGTDSKVFSMHPDNFALNIDALMPEKKERFVDIMQTDVKIQKAGSYTDAFVRLISDYLTDGIMCGEIKPGDKLPSDRELAKKFNVGRSTIREALRVISLIGLIEIRVGQGTFVASESSDFFVTPLSWTLLLGKKSIKDVIDMRNILELGSAEMAARLQNIDLFAEFKGIMQKMEQAHKNYDFKAFLDLDLEFHLMVAKCSGNPIIFELLRTSRKLLTLLSRSGMETLEQIDAIYDEHCNIYESILKGDAEKAAEYMRVHLANSRYRYSYHLNMK